MSDLIKNLENRFSRTPAHVVFYCSGGVKFFLDVGFERWELNTDINNIDLANGQAHEVIMRRENRGRDVYLQVGAVLWG